MRLDRPAKAGHYVRRRAEAGRYVRSGATSVRKRKPSSLPRGSPGLILEAATLDLLLLSLAGLRLLVGLLLRTALLLLCDTILLAHLKASYAV